MEGVQATRCRALAVVAFSIALVVFAAVVMIVRRRRGVVPQCRTRGQWIEELLAAARPRSGAGPVQVLLAAAVVPLVMVELCSDRISGNWWTAPGWMPHVVSGSY